MFPLTPNPISRAASSAVSDTSARIPRLDRRRIVSASTNAGGHQVKDSPLGYWEISTAEVVATQINLVFPADGLFDTSQSDQTV